MLRLYKQEVRRVHPEDLKQIEHGKDEIEQRVSEAAHKIIQRMVHSHRRR